MANQTPEVMAEVYAYILNRNTPGKKRGTAMLKEVRNREPRPEACAVAMRDNVWTDYIRFFEANAIGDSFTAKEVFDDMIETAIVEYECFSDLLATRTAQ